MKIKVQSLISISNTKFILLLSFIFFEWCMIKILNCLDSEIILTTLISIILVAGLLISCFKFRTYLSEIIIDENYITLITRKRWRKSFIQICKNDILNFHVELKVQGPKNCPIASCETIITIKTPKIIYSYTVQPSLNYKFCDYEFFFEILSFQKAFPNFSKNLNITGNKNIYKAIKNRLKKLYYRAG